MKAKRQVLPSRQMICIVIEIKFRVSAVKPKTGIASKADMYCYQNSGQIQPSKQNNVSAIEQAKGRECKRSKTPLVSSFI